MYGQRVSGVTTAANREFAGSETRFDGVETRLGPGDSFYIRPNLAQGAVCRQAGVLIDVFSPLREDFLGKEPLK